MGGTVGANLISLVLLPIITRLFAPEAFGELGMFVAITGILGVCVCFRYELAIVLPKRDAQAYNVWWLCILATLIFTALTSLVIFVIEDILAPYQETLSWIKYIWFIPVVMLIHGTYLSFNHWNTRRKNFGAVSLSKVGNQLGNNASALGFGLAGYLGGKELIIASIIGRFISTLVQFSVLVNFVKTAFKKFRWRYIFYSLKRYKKFPIFGIWSILLGVAAWQLPVILLGFFFPVAVVGFYALGLKILQLPMNLLGNAIGQVFFQQANEFAHQQDKKVINMVLVIIEMLTLLSLVPLVLLACAGREIFGIAFGAEWQEAGLYVTILMPWIFLWFLSAPFTSIFAIYEKQELQLIWNVFNFIFRILAVVIGGVYFKSAYETLMLLSIVGIVIYLAKFWITFKVVKLSAMAVVKKIYGYVLWSITIITAYYLAAPLLKDDYQHIMLVFGLGGFYACWLLYYKSDFIKKVYALRKGN